MKVSNRPEEVKGTENLTCETPMTQAAGRERFYAEFRLRVCRVEREDVFPNSPEREQKRRE